MTDKGFENGCILLLHTTGHTPKADHICFYAKAGDELRVILSDTGDYELIKSLGWQTFTPTVTLVGGAGNTVPEYTTNTGRYNQHGKLVHVCVYLDGDGGDEGAGTGQINIALPITAGSSINGNGIGIVGIATNSAENHILHGIIDASGTTIKFERWSSIKILTSFVGNDQDDTDRYINIHFWYEID